MKTIIITLSIVGILLLGAGLIFFNYVSLNDREVKLRNQIQTQNKVCEAFYDKMWKIINQKAQVAEQYKSAFKEIYPELIEGRYGNEKGGTLLKFIQESNPNFDISLYSDLSESIEAERTGFFMEQKKLLDINNEHINIRSTFFGKLFLGNRPDEKINIITSDKTQKVFEQGKDNDVNLF